MKRILMLLALGGLMAIGANAQDTGDGMGEGEKPSTEKPAPSDEKPADSDAKKAEKKAEKKERKNNTKRNAKNYRELGKIIRELDLNQDRKVSKEEFGADETFDALDKDEDGFLTAQEMLADVDAVKASLAKKAEEVSKEEFSILDRDDSGKLTEAELGKEFAAYMVGDSDDDNELTFEEFMAGRKAAQEAKREEERKKAMDPANIIKGSDKDGDGKISKDEAKRNLKRGFDRLDTNKDGFLDADELKKAMEAMGGRRGQRGQGGQRNPNQPKNAEPKKDKPETGPESKPAPKDDDNGMKEDEF